MARILPILVYVRAHWKQLSAAASAAVGLVQAILAAFGHPGA